MLCEVIALRAREFIFCAFRPAYPRASKRLEWPKLRGIATGFSIHMYRMTVRTMRMEASLEFTQARGSAGLFYRNAWNCEVTLSMCPEIHGSAWMRVKALPIASHWSRIFTPFI